MINKKHPAVMNNDTDIINYYNKNIENPFFDNVVKKVGWHLASKAALEFFGYGHRYDKFPYVILSQNDFEKLDSVLTKIQITFKQLK